VQSAILIARSSAGCSGSRQRSAPVSSVIGMLMFQPRTRPLRMAVS
jgi:hypothetical protein